MRIVIKPTFADCCKYAADMIIETIREKPDARLGLATGSSAQGVYPYLIQANQAGLVDFSQASTINLDEYLGIDPQHPQSYRRFMDENLFDHINIKKENTYVARGIGDPEACVEEFRQKVAEKERDIQLLGIGVDGHVAFNEPGATLESSAHIENLDPSTIQANARFFNSPDEVPRQALSMGMGDIMKAKRIVLVAAGENKAQAVAGLVLNDRIETGNPSTMLKMHPDATILLSEELARQIGYPG